MANGVENTDEFTVLSQEDIKKEREAESSKEKEDDFTVVSSEEVQKDRESGEFGIDESPADDKPIELFDEEEQEIPYREGLTSDTTPKKFEKTELSIEEEAEYTDFKNLDPEVLNWKEKFFKKYGEYPDMDNANYDYRGAFKAGVYPEEVEGQELPVWGSFDQNGKHLKSPDHPTRWKSDYFQLTGEDPDLNEVTKESALKAMADEQINIQHLAVSGLLDDPMYRNSFEKMRSVDPLLFKDKMKSLLKQENRYRNIKFDKPTKRDTGTIAFDMIELLNAGSASLIKGVASTPDFVFDYLGNVSRTLVEGIAYSALGEEEGKKASDAFIEAYKATPGGKNIQKLADVLEYVKDNPATRWLDDVIIDMHNRTNRNEKSIEYYIKTGEYGSAASKAVYGAVEALPASIVAGGLKGGTAALGLTAAADKKDELDKVSNLNESSKFNNALLTGSLEYITEKLGTEQIGGLVKGVFKGQGNDAAQQVMNDSFKSTFKSMYKSLGLYTAPVQEGLTEAANQWGQNWVDIMSGHDPDKNPMSGVIDAFVIGATLGLGGTAVQVSSDATTGVKKYIGRNKDADREMFDQIASDKYGTADAPKIPEEAAREVKLDPVKKEPKKAEPKKDLVAEVKAESKPSYKIGDDVFESKKAFLRKVRQLKGKPNTPNISVNNDEATSKVVQDVLGPDKLTTKTKQDGKQEKTTSKTSETAKEKGSDSDITEISGSEKKGNLQSNKEKVTEPKTNTKSIAAQVASGTVSLTDKKVKANLRAAEKNNWNEESDVDPKNLETETKKASAAQNFKEAEDTKNQKAKESGFSFLGIQRIINPKAKAKKLPPLGTILKKNFSREKGLPKDVFDASIKSEGMLRARQFDIEKSVKESFKSISKSFGGKLTEENLGDLQNLIENIGQTPESLDQAIDAFGKNVPKEAIPVLLEMRKNIDAYTDEIAKLDMIGVNLEEKFDKNRGYYITRTYKKHTDRDWVWDEIPAKIKSDAFNVIMDLNPEFTEDQAKGALRSLLESKDIVSSVASSSQSLKDIDNSLLKKRSQFLTDNPEIRKFLGENKNPFYNYAVSLAKMSEMIERGRMVENLVAIGTKDGWLSKKPSDENNLVKKFSQDSPFGGKPGTEKLSDFYTTPEISEALSRSVAGDPVTGKFMRAYMKMVTATKLAKTAGSVKGNIRNFKSNLLNAIGNGNWNINQTGSELTRRLKSKERDAFYREMYEKGVIGDSANQGELIRNVNELSEKLSFIANNQEGVLEKSGKKVLNATLFTYGLADDVWKAYRYVSEYTRYNKAFAKNMSEQDAIMEAKNKAAAILHQTSTYYSQLPLAVQNLRRLPVVNTFVSFPYLTMTNFIGSVSIGSKEIKTPGLRHIGIQRLSGLALGVGGLATYALLKNRSEGQDEEDMEAWRRFLPAFWKNDMIIIDSVKDGKADYNNLSYLDYYGVVTTPVLVLNRKLMANGELKSEDLVESASDFFGSFLGYDILFDKLTNLTKNVDRSTGFPIYNEQDILTEQWKDISGYMLEVIEPGTITDARRIYKDWRRGEDWQKKAKGVLTGSQIRTIDPVKSLDKFKLYDYRDGINNSQKIYKDELRHFSKLKEPNDNDKKRLKEAKERSISAIRYIVNEVRKDYAALKKVGIKDSEDVMGDILRGKGISNAVKNSILDNERIILNDEGKIEFE